MSWALAADWLAVAGLVLLTFGTGAQAWANLAEFKSVQRTVSVAALETLKAVVVADALSSLHSTSWLRRPLNVLHIRLPQFERVRKWFVIARLALFTIVLMPSSLKQIRADGGEEAVQLARFARLAEVWTILMVGSALGLAAAVIQLGLAYQ